MAQASCNNCAHMKNCGKIGTLCDSYWPSMQSLGWDDWIELVDDCIFKDEEDEDEDDQA